MTPRVDPETRPAATGIQLHRRRRTDQYGTERGRMDQARPRPLVTRNGLPVRPYRYRGTGQSMTPGEARTRLKGR